MNKENRNLYITDLDGTLLNNKAELSEASKKAIELLIRSDVKFTVVTARSVVSVQQMFKNIDLKLPVIEFNGAFISDLKTENIKDIKNESVVCITMIDTYEKLRDVYDDLKDIKDIVIHLQDNIYSPGWFWLTVHSSKATKDKTIKELVNMMGYDNYKLHVFGDNSNDIKMFNIADKAIAVQNAIDELKDIADEIIESNMKDGVTKYILEKENIESNIFTI